MFEEIRQLKSLVLRATGLLFILACFFFVCGPSEMRVFNLPIPLPAPTERTFVVHGYEIMRETLLPSDVTLVAMDPLSTLNTHILLAFLFAFVCAFPILLYMVVGYLAPALYAREKYTLLTVLIPASFLFFTGCWFAYHFIIPPTFSALYAYTKATGTIALFSLDAFVGTVVGFMLVTGLLFLLPVLMALLTYLRVVPGRIWRDNWRYALLIFIIFSAIITPDGSGVSMVLLSLPLCGLYALGTVLTSLKPVPGPAIHPVQD